MRSSSGIVGRFFVQLWLIGLGSALLAGPCSPELRPLAASRKLPVDAPQGVTIDTSSGTLWVASGLSNTVLELDRDLEVVGSLEAPFAPRGITGIAYNPDEDTLLVVQPRLVEVWELRKDGTSTGRVVRLNLEPPVNIIRAPFPRGLAFDPEGDGGRGSLWVVESVRTTIYEVTWNGVTLRSFCHPDDPDGCPGDGRAAFARDIEIVRGAGSLALDLIGGKAGAEVIRRVTADGEPTALSIPLREIGGSPGGFARDTWRDPVSGNLKDVVYVTVESSAEIQVFETIEPTVLPPTSLVCESHLSRIELRWTPNGTYDSVRVLRDRRVLAELAPESDTFVDRDPRDGVLEYTVEATTRDCVVTASCVTVFGAGQVIDHVLFEGGNPQDLTEDREGLMWITTEENQLVVYTMDLEFVRSLAGPFDGPDDHTTGIAYNPRSDTLFVYNTSTHRRAEIDKTGALLDSPTPSGIGADGPDPDGRDAILVASMLFDPAGDGGNGSFWYVDATRARIEERGRDGSRLRTCVSPEAVRVPTMDGTVLAAYLWGLSAVPGQGFRLLETSSGGARDLRATHVLRIDAESCEPTGFEIPFTGMDAVRRPVLVAYLRTTARGRETAFALNPFSSKPHLFRLEARPPPVAPVTEMTCEQPSARRDVLLRFRAPETFERIEVRRDGEIVAVMKDGAGRASSYLDVDVPAGFHTYETVVRAGGLRSEGRFCGVQVGPGSIAQREFADPIVLPHQIAFDPGSGEYVAASRSRRHGEELHFYNTDLRFVRSAPGPFHPPESTAALAVRHVEGESEIFCLGWRPGATPGRQSVLPVRVSTSQGEIIREFEVMTPPAAPLVTFPSGLAWDSATDTLWYLQRNSRMIINVALDGTPLGSFSHPAPLHQDGVKNFGLAIAGERGAMYLSGASRLDQKITKILEVTREGLLTGVEIPVGSRFYTDVDGFALSPDGSSFVAASRLPGITDWVSYRAFDPLAAVTDLNCAIDEELEDKVRLDWTNPVEYDRVVVIRDGVEVASLPGRAESWVDPSIAVEGNAESTHVYRVVGGQGDWLAAGTPCTAWSRGRPPATFLRGDADENGTLNITDALVILGFLFGGSAAPTCHDAADVDDDGAVTISDAISLLSFLFQDEGGVRSPAPPYPIPGFDATMDDLDCR